MHVDIRHFAEFYQTPMGRRVAEGLGRAIHDPAAKNPHDLIVGLGYSQPFLENFGGDGPQKLALMPATLGAMQTSSIPQAMCLPHLLPLRDASVHSLLLIHGLEHAEYPKLMLREVWRVLQDDGSATIVVPYRPGFWARSSEQPFGLGTPYSSRQLRNLLEGNGYSIEYLGFGLHFPPWQRGQRFLPTLARLYRFCRLPAGVLVIRAKKSLLQPVQNLSKTFNREKILLPAQQPQRLP